MGGLVVHGHKFMTRVELCVLLTKFVSTKATFCQTHFSPSSNLVFVCCIVTCFAVWVNESLCFIVLMAHISSRGSSKASKWWCCPSRKSGFEDDCGCGSWALLILCGCVILSRGFRPVFQLRREGSL